ncbi:unnamed protein product, partial [Bubo scandiacus]
MPSGLVCPPSGALARFIPRRWGGFGAPAGGGLAIPARGQRVPRVGCAGRRREGGACMARGGPPPLVRLLAVWINMRKMRLSLCLLSAPARGWVTALFGAAGGAVPTRTWQAKPGGQGEGDEGAGAAAGAAVEGRGRRPASERGGFLAACASLSLPLSRARLRPGWCRQNENVFCFVFLASPQQRYQPRPPPPFSLVLSPTRRESPFTIGTTQVLEQQKKKKGQKYPLAPKPPPIRHPRWRLLPTFLHGGWVVVCIYFFLSLFFSPPPIGSLSRWVCTFLFKDPPPPVVLKPGRREPRAHFCLDAGAAGEGAGDGGREEGGGGRAGGKRSPGGGGKKKNPPPQAFCL